MIINKPVLYIRKATPEDARALGILQDALYEELSLLRPEDCNPSRPGAEQSAIKLIGQSNIYVAVEFDAVVGFIALAERELTGIRPYRGLRYAAVEGIFVDPIYRGRGIGTALIQEAKRWGASRGLEYLELTLFSDSREAVYLCRQERFTDVRQTLRYVYD
jgi:GNAT superfamily N-acetyltransferase